jgi:hypothetical protein
MKQGILRSALNPRQKLELTYRQPVNLPAGGTLPTGPATSQAPTGNRQ